jgi:LuxR family transcriptional regulator, maltose regulon positive regulatory protein
MIISTKIRLPLLKSNLLNRNHLINRLCTAKKWPLVIVTGSAGYGKTSLAVQWVKRCNLRVAWYSIDDEDNDFDVFFRYLMAALIEADTRFEETVGPLLHVQTRFSEKDVIPAIVHAFNVIGENIYLILDDYHVIQDDGIHRTLSRIIRYLPVNMHIVIISRYKLPQSLFRLKLQYDVLELDQDDMKFSEHEAEMFFKQVIPLNLSRNQIRDLTRFTGGWVAGFQIFGLSLKGKKNLEGIDETIKTASGEVIGYLINEVVGDQPEKVKSFLYHTAVLNRFNAEVCEFITGLPDAGKILGDLCRMNLFLVPMDPEQVWYGYHQLFSQAVCHWVRASCPGLLEQARKKAAIWFARHHYLEDAFHYASASGDFEFTADLLEDYLIFLFERYEVASSLRWLTKLPREVFLKRPLLRLFECAFKIDNRESTDIDPVLRDIEGGQSETIEQLEEGKKRLCRDLLVYLKAVSGYYRNVDVDVEQLQAAIEAISPANRPLAGIIRILIATRHMVIFSDLKSAEDQMKIAAGDISPFESVLAKMNWAVIMASVLRLQGSLTQSEKILEEAFVFLNQKKLYDAPLKYLLYLPMAWIFFQRNELEKASEYGVVNLRYAERAGHTEAILSGCYLLSRICMAKGDHTEAMRYAHKMRSISKPLEMSSLSNFSDALLPLLFISMNPGYTDKQAGGGKFHLLEPFSLHALAEAMTRAILLLYQGKLQETIFLLEDLHEKCAKRHIMEILLDIDILLSGVLLLTGDREKALGIMKETLNFTEQEGYVRPFVTYSPLILPLLRHFAKNPKNSLQAVYVDSLMKACALQKNISSVTSHPGPKKNSYGLSQREIEILRLMTHGYKNREIAEMTYVSINTVKTHVQNIFRKLDVKSRLQAILRGKEV